MADQRTLVARVQAGAGQPARRDCRANMGDEGLPADAFIGPPAGYGLPPE